MPEAGRGGGGGWEWKGLEAFLPHVPHHISVLENWCLWDTGKTWGCSVEGSNEEGRGAAHICLLLLSPHQLFLQKGKPKVASWKQNLWEYFRTQLDAYSL